MMKDIFFEVREPATKPNLKGYSGYVSWLPKNKFETTYEPTEIPSKRTRSDLIYQNGPISIFVKSSLNGKFENTYTYHLDNSLPHSKFVQNVYFQNGRPDVHGANGLTNEASLAMVLHRIGKLNELLPCQENEEAMKLISQAIEVLKSRQIRMLRVNQFTPPTIIEEKDKSSY